MAISAVRADAIAQAIACRDDEYLASVGHAWTSIDIEILDEEGLACTAGEVGEVAERGPSISGGTSIRTSEHLPEEALLHHSAVREGSVIGIPDPEWREAKPRSTPQRVFRAAALWL